MIFVSNAKNFIPCLKLFIMKKILKYSFLFLIIILTIGVYINYPKLDLISGFSAKSVASAHFIDGRPLTEIEEGDNDIELVKLASNKILVDEKVAISSVFGLKKRKAIFREGLGATLIDDGYDEKSPYLIPKRNKTSIKKPYPYGNLEPVDTVFKNINYIKLQESIAKAFDNKNEKLKRTRAVVVLYKGKLIGEKYCKGFNKDSKILGWSMTKSITATYFGILEKQGKLSIQDKAPIVEWQKDKRKNITLHNLLQMNSGLEWEEDYGKISDATTMLFNTKDMTKSQLNKPLTGNPNQSWNYSSGTTNLLSGILRSYFSKHQDYLDFWYSSLIDKIGMHSMLIETDMMGNYVGSSYGWATARDWAKFGQLYLDEGQWNGEQLFLPSWSKYVAQPTNGSNGKYGGHFWLNANGDFPDVPKDMYRCGGFQGQMIAIIPSKNLVVVRMGLSESFDFNGFLKDIISSVP